MFQTLFASAGAVLGVGILLTMAASSLLLDVQDGLFKDDNVRSTAEASGC